MNAGFGNDVEHGIPNGLNRKSGSSIEIDGNDSIAARWKEKQRSEHQEEERSNEVGASWAAALSRMDEPGRPCRHARRRTLNPLPRGRIEIGG